MIEPELTMMEEFYAVGYTFPGPEGQFNAMDNAGYWGGQDFGSVSAEEYASLADANWGEVATWVRFSNKGETPYYFFGPIVTEKKPVPKGMVPVRFPGAVYAAFEVPHFESGEEMRKIVSRMWQEDILPWIANSVTRPDPKARCFEYYMGDKCYIYVPVESKVSK